MGSLDRQRRASPLPGLFTWNTEWAAPKSKAWHWACAELQTTCTVGVLTEVRLDALSQWGGHVAAGGENWGYSNQHPLRRKVSLFSHSEIRDIDEIGSSRLPPGRFVAGTTKIGDFDVRLIGVCVPWADAHVSTGRASATRWSEHLQFLQGLADAVAGNRRHGLPLVLAGDFNQTIREPRAKNLDVVVALDQVLAPFELVTKNVTGPRLLDHIAVDKELVDQPVTCTRFVAEIDGKRLSDHDAVVC